MSGLTVGGPLLSSSLELVGLTSEPGGKNGPAERSCPGTAEVSVPGGSKLGNVGPGSNVAAGSSITSSLASDTFLGSGVAFFSSGVSFSSSVAESSDEGVVL